MQGDESVERVAAERRELRKQERLDQAEERMFGARAQKIHRVLARGGAPTEQEIIELEGLRSPTNLRHLFSPQGPSGQGVGEGKTGEVQAMAAGIERDSAAQLKGCKVSTNARTGKGPKLDMMLVQKLLRCLFNGGTGIMKFDLGFQLLRNSTFAPERFFAKLFPREYKVRIKVVNTPSQKRVEACVKLGFSKRLSKSVTFLQPKLCLGKQIKKGWLGAAKTYIKFDNALQIKIDKDTLKFIGRIKVDPGEAQLRARMEGLWNNPLGMKGISMDNLELGMGFAWTGPWPPIRYVFGGAVGMGSECHLAMKKGNMSKRAGELVATKGKQFKCFYGRVVFSLHTTNPKATFFGVQISRLMLPDLVDFVGSVAGVKLDVSKWGPLLTTTGFPVGLAMSFALRTMFAPGGYVIPGGFAFTGKMVFLGWSGFAKIQFAPIERRFLLLMEMTPVKLGGGLLRIQRSKRDESNGPKCIVVLNLPFKKLANLLKGGAKKMTKKESRKALKKKVKTLAMSANGSRTMNIDIEGYISFFGIGQYGRIRVTPRKFLFVVETSLFLGLVGRFAVKMALPLGALEDAMTAEKKGAAVLKALGSTKLAFIYSLMVKPWHPVKQDNAGLNKLLPKVLGALKTRMRAAIARLKKAFRGGKAELEALERSETEVGEEFGRRRKNKDTGPTRRRRSWHASGHAKAAATKAKSTVSKSMRRLSAFKKLLKSMKEGANPRYPPSKRFFWMCGAWVRGHIGATLPPMLHAELQVLVRGRRTMLRLYLDTGSISRTVSKMAESLWSIVRALTKAMSGPGTETCKFPVPLVTKPKSRPKMNVTEVPDPSKFTSTPTAAPTAAPTASPTATPSSAPTASPTASPTATNTAGNSTDVKRHLRGEDSKTYYVYRVGFLAGMGKVPKGSSSKLKPQLTAAEYRVFQAGFHAGRLEKNGKTNAAPDAETTPAPEAEVDDASREVQGR